MQARRVVGAEIVYPFELGEPATWPLAPRLCITRWVDDGLAFDPWPWPLVLENPEGVLVNDVLEGIYANLAEYVLRSEWIAIGEKRREGAWRMRLQRLEEHAKKAREDGESPPQPDNVQRGDLLLENRNFRGRSLAPEGEGWMINFGPPH